MRRRVRWATRNKSATVSYWASGRSKRHSGRRHLGRWTDVVSAMIRSAFFVAASAALALSAPAARSAEPQAPVQDVSVVCRAGFADGSSAEGRGVRIIDSQDHIVREAVVETDGVFGFVLPSGEYRVIFQVADGEDAPAVECVKRSAMPTPPSSPTA